MAPSRGTKIKPRMKLISHGRPFMAQRSAPQSSRRTRSIIRSHHQMHKARANAVAKGDRDLAAELEAKIQAQGGLEEYQRASITGQSATRGGDSSKVLVTWCRELGLADANQPLRRLRLLEVGALSVDNACSTSGIFDMQRIDLHSQGHGILQQDFMARPLPRHDDEKFEVISLSLVLNYVPDAIDRGEMLKRTRQFLRTTSTVNSGHSLRYPVLFLVLPAPCVENSRYLSREKLEEILSSLGFNLVCEKVSSKLAYSLWRLKMQWPSKTIPHSKVEVNPGKRRNNFAITLQ